MTVQARDTKYDEDGPILVSILYPADKTQQFSIESKWVFDSVEERNCWLLIGGGRIKVVATSETSSTACSNCVDKSGTP